MLNAGLTITLIVSFTTQKLPSITVHIYVVVFAGFANGLAIETELNPATGSHEY